jgi:hypothetical protein
VPIPRCRCRKDVCAVARILSVVYRAVQCSQPVTRSACRLRVSDFSDVVSYDVVSMSTPSPIAQSSPSSIRPTKKSSAALSPPGNMSSGTTFSGKKEDLRACPVCAGGCCVGTGSATGGKLSKGDSTGVNKEGCVA